MHLAAYPVQAFKLSKAVFYSLLPCSSRHALQRLSPVQGSLHIAYPVPPLLAVAAVASTWALGARRRLNFGQVRQYVCGLTRCLYDREHLF